MLLPGSHKYLIISGNRKNQPMLDPLSNSTELGISQSSQFYINGQLLNVIVPVPLFSLHQVYSSSSLPWYSCKIIWLHRYICIFDIAIKYFFNLTRLPLLLQPSLLALLWPLKICKEFKNNNFHQNYIKLRFSKTGNKINSIAYIC